jgi:hypothetical protein
MPEFLKLQAMKNNNKEILQFCDLFKIVGQNTCLLDRTGKYLQVPFDSKILFPIPQTAVHNNATFEDLCIERSKQILRESNNITVFYSGGLDSTTVMVGFEQAIKAGIGSADQITIAATPHSIVENPEFWTKHILPNYTLKSINNELEKIGDVSQMADRYVMGENADQLFGSDMILANFGLFKQDINTDNIITYISKNNIPDSSKDFILNVFERMYDARVCELKNMANLLWWFNMSCKWQSVALRTLCFTNFLDSITKEEELKMFETFFNTQEFQSLSLYGNLRKWGTPETPYNYKLAAREFIQKYTGLTDYTTKKVKLPSLYRVLATSTYKYIGLGEEDGKLYRLQEIK